MSSQITEIVGKVITKPLRIFNEGYIVYTLKGICECMGWTSKMGRIVKIKRLSDGELFDYTPLDELKELYVEYHDVHIPCGVEGVNYNTVKGKPQVSITLDRGIKHVFLDTNFWSEVIDLRLVDTDKKSNFYIGDGNKGVCVRSIEKIHPNEWIDVRMSYITYQHNSDGIPLPFENWLEIYYEVPKHKQNG